MQVGEYLQRARELVDEVWGVRAFWNAAGANGWFEWSSALHALAALWLVGCGWFVALTISRTLLPRGGLPLRLSSTCCAGMWLAMVGFHALRSLSAFRLHWALLAASLLAAACVRWGGGSMAARRRLRHEVRAIRACTRVLMRSHWLFGLFAGVALLLALRSLLIPPLGWDTLTYHGPRAAQWVQTGQFTFDAGIGSYDLYRHFFAGGETLSAWAMLPFHSDLLVNLAGVVQWLGFGLSSWALARALGLREPFAGTAACVLMFAPTVQLEVNSGYVEVALNACILHGLALAISVLRKPDPKATLLCTLSLGAAVGIKVPGAPAAATILAALALRLAFTRTLPARNKLWTFVVGATSFALPSLPFMERAMLDTGAPLSPIPMRVFGFDLGIASPAMRWLLRRPDLAPYTWPVERVALLKLFSPLSGLNESLGSMALIPLLVAPFGLLVLLRRKPLAALLVATVALLPVLAHFGTGLNTPRLLRSISTARYLVTSLALLVPLSLTWCSRTGLVSHAYRRLLFVYPLTHTVILLRHGAGEWETRELVIVGALIAQAVWLVRWAWSKRRWLSIALAVASFALGCSLLQMRRDETRVLAYQRSYALHNWPRFWIDAVSLVDEPQAVHRLAITGGPDHSADKWFHYFFLGKRLQNTVHYVVPTRDGAFADFGPHGDLRVRADFASWTHRLAAAGITEVVTFPPRSIEQGWMEQAPEQFAKLAGQDDWGLFRLQH